LDEEQVIIGNPRPVQNYSCPMALWLECFAHIAGTVAAMTESEPGVPSERTSCPTLG
jgi:hypothetical protein